VSGDRGLRWDQFARRFQVVFLVVFAVIGLAAKAVDYAFHTSVERFIFPITTMAMFAHPPRASGLIQERIERARGDD